MIILCRSISQEKKNVFFLFEFIRRWFPRALCRFSRALYEAFFIESYSDFDLQASYAKIQALLNYENTNWMHSSHAYFWAPPTGALHPPGATIWTFVFSFYMAAFYWCYVALQLWRYHLWILEPCSYLLTSSSRVSSSPRTFFLKSLLRLFRMGELLFVCSPSHFQLRTLSRLQRRCKSPEKATPSKLSWTTARAERC